MADKKLVEVRSCFVECANKSVISQILDDLLENKVLNEEEAEEVKAASWKQEQARILIDHSRRKGVKASQIFVDSLQRRDPLLAEQLGLKDYSCASPGTQIPESRQGIKLCPPALFQKIQAEEGNDIYPILDPKERTRLALIICNIDFAHLSKRKGAEVDLAEMRHLLEGLGYTVEVEKDLSSQGMEDCLRRFAARKEHKTSDSTFIVLMSHGLRDSLCGVECQSGDSNLLSVDTVFSTFNNRNCQALWKKPKVIIIQACRGENYGEVSMSDSGASSAAQWSPREFEHDAVQKVHVESDFICMQSTTPDNVSWRRPETGSVFLIKLREQLQEHAWQCHLEEVFRKVLLCFEKNPRQMPSKDRTTLSRKFYLFPGH